MQCRRPIDLKLSAIRDESPSRLEASTSRRLILTIFESPERHILDARKPRAHQKIAIMAISVDTDLFEARASREMGHKALFLYYKLRLLVGSGAGSPWDSLYLRPAARTG